MSLEKIVLVKKPTALEELKRRHSTVSQVQFYLDSKGESFDDYLAMHTDYHQGLAQAKKSLPSEFRRQEIDPSLLGTYQFGPKDLAVVVGDPGLFVNVAKYVGNQPVIVVNPDPQRFANNFTTCSPQDVGEYVQRVMSEQAQMTYHTMATATTNHGQTLSALNDFFVGNQSHVSARYTLLHKQKTERHSSDGVIISTGSGSTGWFSSILGSAYALAGDRMDPEQFSFDPNSEYLQFVVRNAFCSPLTGNELLQGMITANNPLYIHSQMPFGGVVFSDGVLSDYLEFTTGTQLKIEPSAQKVCRVVP